MREIKFRAYWEEWEGMYMFDIYNVPMLPDEAVVMQYTGLKDKNGKEIYEGDILVYVDVGNLTDDFIEPVFWDAERGEYRTDSSEHVWSEVAKLSKIIGSIYENPELLK